MIKVHIKNRDEYDFALSILERDKRCSGKFYKEGEHVLLLENSNQIDLLRECGISLFKRS